MERRSHSADDSWRYGAVGRTAQSVRRVVARAARRAALAAGHHYALGLLVLTAVASCVSAAAGAQSVTMSVMFAGAVVFCGFVAAHVVFPSRGDALYGPLGPPLEPEVRPDHVVSEIRSTYAAVLTAHARVRRLLEERDGTAEVLLDSYRRCGDLVHLAGRIVQVGNGLQSYIREHDRDQLEMAVKQARRRALESSDPWAERAYERTAEARERQLQRHDEFCELRDRLEARLELITASLDSVQALIVKLHARLLDQSTVTGCSVGELDVFNEELELLEEALDEALRGPPLEGPEPSTVLEGLGDVAEESEQRAPVASVCSTA